MELFVGLLVIYGVNSQCIYHSTDFICKGIVLTLLTAGCTLVISLTEMLVILFFGKRLEACCCFIVTGKWLLEKNVFYKESCFIWAPAIVKSFDGLLLR